MHLIVYNYDEKCRQLKWNDIKTSSWIEGYSAGCVRCPFPPPSSHLPLHTQRGNLHWKTTLLLHSAWYARDLTLFYRYSDKDSSPTLPKYIMERGQFTRIRATRWMRKESLFRREIILWMFTQTSFLNFVNLNQISNSFAIDLASNGIPFGAKKIGTDQLKSKIWFR